MNVQELQQRVAVLNKLAVVWSRKASLLTEALTSNHIPFEEAGFDADWRVIIFLDDGKAVSIRYNGGLRMREEPE
jgi:hypothetical protein